MKNLTIALIVAVLVLLACTPTLKNNDPVYGCKQIPDGLVFAGASEHITYHLYDTELNRVYSVHVKSLPSCDPLQATFSNVIGE